MRGFYARREEAKEVVGEDCAHYQMAMIYILLVLPGDTENKKQRRKIGHDATANDKQFGLCTRLVITIKTQFIS